MDKRIGRYAITSVLGRGSSGIVYRASHVDLGRSVALKILSQIDSDPSALARFRREGEAIARLQHPRVVTLYESGEDGGVPFLAMELIEGMDLRRAISEGKLSRRDRVRVVTDAARGLAHAHDRGVIHRDIKPGNILVDAELRGRISDFGLAVDLRHHRTLTRSGDAVGTPAYMAPERLRRRVVESPELADIYSLGAVLYECLAGRTPFIGESELDVFHRILEEEPDSPRRFDRTIDSDLETICLKCLQKIPDLRYTSAEALALDLEAWLDGRPIAARPQPISERIARRMRRHARWIAFFGALAAIFSVLFVLLWGERARGRALADQAIQDSVGRELRESIRERRFGSALLQARAIRDGSGERGSKRRELMEAVRGLREAGLYEVAYRVSAWIETDQDPSALSLRAECLADCGLYREALRILSLSDSSVRSNAQERVLAALARGRTYINRAEGASPIVQTMAVDLDHDSKCDLLALGKDASIELLWFRGAPTRMQIQWDTPREFTALRAWPPADFDGDGWSEILLSWDAPGGTSEFVSHLCVLKWVADGDPSNLTGVRLERTQFHAEYSPRGISSAIVGELDGRPGKDLVVARGPNFREVLCYSSAALHGFPEAPRVQRLDGGPNADHIDVEALALVPTSSTHRSILLAGTGHHLGHDLRTYRSDDHGRLRLLADPLVVGRCATILPLSFDATARTIDGFVGTSYVAPDRLLLPRIQRAGSDDLLSAGIIPFRLSLGGDTGPQLQLNRMIRRQNLVAPLAEGDLEIIDSLQRFRAARDRTALFTMSVVSQAAQAPQYSVARARRVWLSADTRFVSPESVSSIALPQMSHVGDLDGDQLDELIVESPRGWIVLGLGDATMDERISPRWGFESDSRSLELALLEVVGRCEMSVSARTTEPADSVYATATLRRLLATGAQRIPDLAHGIGSAPSESLTILLRPSMIAASSSQSSIAARGAIQKPESPGREPLEMLLRLGAAERDSDVIRSISFEAPRSLGWTTVPIPDAAAGFGGFCWKNEIGQLPVIFPMEPPENVKKRTSLLQVDFYVEPMDFGSCLRLGWFGGAVGNGGVLGIELKAERTVNRPLRTRKVISVDWPDLARAVPRHTAFPTGAWMTLRVLRVPAMGVSWIELRYRERGDDEPPIATALSLADDEPQSSGLWGRLGAAESRAMQVYVAKASLSWISQ